MNTEVKTPVTETPKAAEKISAGDAAIQAAVKPGANVKQFRKALWSIRGDLTVEVAGSKAQVAVVKAAIVKDLDALKDEVAAPFMLVSRGKGAYELKAIPPAKK
jgi:hypothetical protein